MPSTHNFSDVFVSYSRRNKIFVEKLTIALRQHPSINEIWVDWEDIPESVDWWEEIKAGIEGANTFLFILTPDSARSSVCFDEIEHAMISSKRIVPIVHIDVTDDDDFEKLHPAIKRHNWIMFREDDDFNERFEDIIGVLSTDVDHVNKHTRYFVRSKEWIENSKENSYLLTGVELEIAERWLREANKNNKQPEPTQTQTVFIHSSRRVDDEIKAETQRREKQIRRFQQAAVLLGVFLVLAVLATVVSINQVGSAIDNASTATFAQGDAIVQANNAQTQVALVSTAEAEANNNAATATIAQGEALVQADNVSTQAAIASTSESEARRNALTATVAQGEALMQANNILTQIALVSTAEAEANNNAATATIAQGEAVIQANNAETQVALVSTAEAEANNNAATATVAQGEALIQANIAVTQAALAATSENEALENAVTATIAQGEAVVQANIANTQAAIATVAQGRAIQQADLAATSESEAVIAGNNAVLEANNAQTQAAVAATAQAEAIIQANIAATSESDAQFSRELAQSLALASSALQFRDSNSVLSLALALEANNFSNPDNQAERVLISIAYEAPRKFFLNETGGIRDVETLEISTQQASDIESSALIDATLDFRIFTADDMGLITEWDPDTGLVVDQLQRHRSAVNTIDVWSNQGNSQAYMVSGDQSGRLFIWDLNTNLVERELTGQQTDEDTNIIRGHTRTINTVEFARDGSLVVSASEDGRVIIWDAESGEPIREILVPGRVGIKGATLSHDSELLLIWSNEAMRLIGIQSERFLEFGIGDDGLVRIGEETDRIRSAIFSPDGSFIITTGSNGRSSPEVWDVQNRTLLRRLPEHTGPINSVAVSSDGQFVLSSSDDFTMILSSLVSGAEVKRYNAHQNRVVKAIFTDVDQRIVSTSSDGQMYLWDKLAISRSAQSLDGYDNINVDAIVQLPFDPELFLTSSSDGELGIWSTVSGTLIQSFSSTASGIPQKVLDINPMSTEDDILIALADENIQIMDLLQQVVLQSIVVNPLAEYEIVNPLLLESHWINSIDFSPDGQTLLTGGGFFARTQRQPDDVIFQGIDTAYPMLHLWDTSTGELIRQFDTRGFVIEDGIDAAVTAIAFSPSGESFVSGLQDGRLRIWSPITGTYDNEFVGHLDEITAIAFSPDGAQLATASQDRAIILWDYETGLILQRFTEHNGSVNDIAFSSDGRYLLSGSDDTRVILWDIEVGSSTQQFFEHDTAISSVAFVLNGDGAVSGALDGTLVSRRFDIGTTDLGDWIVENRYIPILTCIERERFGLTCEEDTN